MRIVNAIAAVSLLFAASSAFAQSPSTPSARTSSQAATNDEPVPRAARAKARQECRDEHIALTGNDLRAAMRDCIQARFPGVQLYARDGVTRDGKPTAAAARTACKTEVDEKGLSGSSRTAALVACFNGKRPDLAQRAECRKEARDKGLDGEELRKAIAGCARDARS